MSTTLMKKRNTQRESRGKTKQKSHMEEERAHLITQTSLVIARTAARSQVQVGSSSSNSISHR